MFASWLGWTLLKRGSGDWTVCCFPCLALSHSNLASLSSVVSAASLSFICCKIWCLFQWHSQLQTFRFVLKGTHLLQSGVFISSSFSCQAFTSVPLVVCLLLSLSSCYFSQRYSFPPLIGSLGQLWSRISAAFCVQSVYRTVITCIHGHTVGTHAPAAYFDVAANTTAIPCTVSWHTWTVLLSSISVIFQAHFRARHG